MQENRTKNTENRIQNIDLSSGGTIHFVASGFNTMEDNDLYCSVGFYPMDENL
jgi:hypothetical protein